MGSKGLCFNNQYSLRRQRNQSSKRISRSMPELHSGAFFDVGKTDAVLDEGMENAS